MLFLAMWTLKTHKYWAELAQRHERRIEQLGDESQRLAEGLQKEGELVEPGIRQVNLELYKLLLDRRRAWFHCDPKLIKVGDDGTAEITLSIEQPVPHGIADKNKKAVVYAFEEADVQKKGQYLGEFAASGVDDKRVLLTPTAKLTTREINRLKKLAKTKGPWVLYEMLPRDNHELFAGLGDEQLKALLPAGVLPEYLKDGKPAAPDDPKERVQGGKYVRQLRDYGVLLGADQEKRILLSDSIEAAANDKQLLDEALADARKQEEGCKKDIAKATKDLKKSAGQRDEVAAYRKQLEDKLAAIQALVARLIATNQAMAGQMAKFQLQAAERIDARTRAMAQSAAERR